MSSSLVTNPLAPVCFHRWRTMDFQSVLDEAAVLMQLAVQIDDVRAAYEKELKKRHRKKHQEYVWTLPSHEHT